MRCSRCARAVVLRDLLVEQRDASHYVSAFIKTVAGDNARNMVVETCVVNADQFFVDTVGAANGPKIIANQIAVVNANALNIIDSAAFFGEVLGNHFSVDDARNGVKLEAGAKGWRINGNHFFVSSVRATVNTAASAGANAIVGNTGTNVGATITAAGTDQVGLNA